jgi:PAS domain S-box-containing protein
MDKALRVLNLEDNDNDSVLLQRHLKRAGYTCVFRREQSVREFERALREEQWDIILADYYLPGLSAVDALRGARECGADIPFIVVSGAVGEELAVDLLREGAADYVMKDNLTRLVPAIERELQKCEERRRRRAAESALRESEMRLRGILENSPTAVFMKDIEGRYLLVNRSYMDLLGRSEAEICGKTDEQLFPSKYAALFTSNEAKVSAAGAPMQFEEELPLHDGMHTRIANRFPLRDATGKIEGVCSICTDITELKKSEESMRRTEKLAAAGRLAASIAHEINNPLEALMNLLFLLRGRPELQPDTRAFLEVAEQELNRVSHIARQSLAFYHESTGPNTVELSQMLRSLVDLYGHKLRQRDIRIDVDAGAECLVHSVEGELRQVFSNLLANAIDAVRFDGRIAVRVRPARDRSGNPGVRVVVADTGCGISRENQPRIFEAFFTTKTDGTGTGLGLWVTQQLLRKNNASMRIRSSDRPGASGTVMSVFVPCGVREPLGETVAAAAA